MRNQMTIGELIEHCMARDGVDFNTRIEIAPVEDNLIVDWDKTKPIKTTNLVVSPYTNTLAIMIKEEDTNGDT